MYDELDALTADGVTLRIDRVTARGSRRGAVVCLHAMMTDGRYFGARRDGSFASTLADAGLDVYVADFRGHGRSVPPRAGRGDWTFDDLVELDLPAIVGAAAAASGMSAGELAILGHSLGGLVACAALGTGRIPPPRVLGLAATSVWLGETLRRRTIMRAYRGITKLLGRAPIRALRIGTADEAAGYVDQLTGWAKHGRWTSLRGIDYRAALDRIATPTFAFTGATDWMCQPRDANQIAKRIPASEPLRVVGKTSGDLIDPDHFELFTRAELTALHREIAEKLTPPAA
ncbi:MAG: alpha/beta fold hydrolase [Kofleriaceae bacterium]|nr:alpha/beta fold hydrolase [Kofleriaceae bacterium]